MKSLNDIARLEKAIGQRWGKETVSNPKSWWDTVDTVASHFTGAVVYQYPKTGKVMDKWIDDENMWIRRTAILHQLNFKERTNEDRLFCYCEKRMHESEFFI